MSLKNLAEGRTDLFKVSPNKIHIKDGFNSREDFGDLEELAEEIRAQGLLNPLTVFEEDKKIYVENGERRLRAIKLLQDKGIKIGPVPCLKSPAKTRVDAVSSQLAYSGKPFTQYEEIRLVKKLNEEFKLKQKEIATKLKRTAAWVSERLLLAKTSPETLESIKSGQISGSVVTSLAREFQGEELTKQVKNAIEVANQNGYKKASAQHAQTARKRSKPRIPSPEPQSTYTFSETINNDESMGIEVIIETIENLIKQAQNAYNSTENVDLFDSIEQAEIAIKNLKKSSV